MGRRRQSVTIKHVAADAGVSLQTVSRVINNEPNVRAEMKERVQASTCIVVMSPPIRYSARESPSVSNRSLLVLTTL